MSRQNTVDERSNPVDTPFQTLLAYNGAVRNVCHSHRVTPTAMHDANAANAANASRRGRAALREPDDGVGLKTALQRQHSTAGIMDNVEAENNLKRLERLSNMTESQTGHMTKLLWGLRDQDDVQRYEKKYENKQNNNKQCRDKYAPIGTHLDKADPTDGLSGPLPYHVGETNPQVEREKQRKQQEAISNDNAEYDRYLAMLAEYDARNADPPKPPPSQENMDKEDVHMKESDGEESDGDSRDLGKPFKPVIVEANTKTIFDIIQKLHPSDPPWKQKQNSFNQWWADQYPFWTCEERINQFDTFLLDNNLGERNTRKAVVCFRRRYFWLSNMFPTIVSVEAKDVLFMAELNKAKDDWTKFKQQIDKTAFDHGMQVELIDTTIAQFDTSKMLTFPSVEHGFVCGKINIAQIGVELITTYIKEYENAVKNGNDRHRESHGGIAALSNKFIGACAMWEIIREAETAKIAKQMGMRYNPEKLTIRPEYLIDMGNWKEKLAEEWMETLLHAKFSKDDSGQRHHLHDLLISLKSYLIVEGNYYRDDDWGAKIVPYKEWEKGDKKAQIGTLQDENDDKVVLVGNNKLGRLLMKLCKELNTAKTRENKLLIIARPGAGGRIFGDQQKPFGSVIVEDNTKTVFEVFQSTSDSSKMPWEHNNYSFITWWATVTPSGWNSNLGSAFDTFLLDNKRGPEDNTRKAVICFRHRYFWLSNMFPTMVTIEEKDVLYMDKLNMSKNIWTQFKKKGDNRMTHPNEFKLIDDTLDLFDTSKMLTFPSVEHGFVCGKINIAQLGAQLIDRYIDHHATRKYGIKPTLTLDEIVKDFTGACAMWETIRTAETAKIANGMGGSRYNENKPNEAIHPFYLHYMADWHNTLSEKWMKRLLRAKFSKHDSGKRHYLHDLLKSLDNYLIVEGNYYHDKYWGADIVPYEKWVQDTVGPRSPQGDKKELVGTLQDEEGGDVVLVGNNKLGLLLMDLRDEIINADLNEMDQFMTDNMFIYAPSDANKSYISS